LNDDHGKHWRVLSSRYPVKDRWLALRADRCLTERGVALDPYYVVEVRDFVHAVILDDADNIVLVRQYRHGAQKMSLELPGGVMDLSDASVLETAVRELAEETGYAAPDLELIASLSPDTARYSNTVHFLFGSGARRVSETAFDATEDIEVLLIPFHEAIDLALSGGIQNAAHVAGLLMVAARKRPALLSPRGGGV
jgi:8-oxo-dGTP pyrophosphatase MutT (NUDIX family)